MPSRPIAAVILLGWLATVGWFGHREVWPLLFPSDAPPFVIELGDEISSQMSGVKRPDVLWGIYRSDKHGEKRIGRAETRLWYHAEDNTHEMETRVVQLKLLLMIEVPELITAYRINTRGELRRMRMKGSMKIAELTGDASFEGVVVEKQLHRSVSVNVPFLGLKAEPKLEPIEAPRGSFLNPMHPVPKIKNLRPGRSWRMPVLNPLEDAIEPALGALLGKKPDEKVNLKLPRGPTHLDAVVLTETEDVVYNNTAYPCRIIEFRGQDRPARTYVRISDGAVLLQEVYMYGERLSLKRE